MIHFSFHPFLFMMFLTAFLFYNVYQPQGQDLCSTTFHDMDLNISTSTYLSPWTLHDHISMVYETPLFNAKADITQHHKIKPGVDPCHLEAQQEMVINNGLTPLSSLKAAVNLQFPAVLSIVMLLGWFIIPLCIKESKKGQHTTKRANNYTQIQRGEISTTAFKVLILILVVGELTLLAEGQVPETVGDNKVKLSNLGLITELAPPHTVPKSGHNSKNYIILTTTTTVTLSTLPSATTTAIPTARPYSSSVTTSPLPTQHDTTLTASISTLRTPATFHLSRCVRIVMIGSAAIFLSGCLCCMYKEVILELVKRCSIATMMGLSGLILLLSVIDYMLQALSIISQRLTALSSEMAISIVNGVHEAPLWTYMNYPIPFSLVGLFSIVVVFTACYWVKAKDGKDATCHLRTKPTTTESGSDQNGGRPGQLTSPGSSLSEDNTLQGQYKMAVSKLKMTKRQVLKLKRQLDLQKFRVNYVNEYDSSSESSTESPYSTAYKQEWQQIERDTRTPQGKNAKEQAEYEWALAADAMALIDEEWFDTARRHVKDKEIIQNDGGDALYHPLPIYALETTDEVLAMTAEQAANNDWDAEAWWNANKNCSPETLQKNLANKIKERRQAQRQPRPIPMEVQASMWCINDLRRYLYENTAREKVWQRAGTAMIPPEVMRMNYGDVVAWVREWKERVWNEKMSKEGFGLTRCPDCNLMVRPQDHKCFVVKSRKLEYKGGLPLRKQTQIATKGGKIITISRKQLDLDKALENYNKAFGDIPVTRPTEERPNERQVPSLPAPITTGLYSFPSLDVNMDNDLRPQPTVIRNPEPLPVVTSEEPNVVLMARVEAASSKSTSSRHRRAGTTTERDKLATKDESKNDSFANLRVFPLPYWIADPGKCQQMAANMRMIQK